MQSAGRDFIVIRAARRWIEHARAARRAWTPRRAREPRANVSRLAIAGLGIALTTLGLGQTSAPADDKPTSNTQAGGSIAFREVAEQAGISFRFETGARGQ